MVSGNEGAAGVLVEWFGEHWWSGRNVALLAAMVVVLLPLVMLRRVGEWFNLFTFFFFFCNLAIFRF